MKLSVVVPAHNEADNIVDLIEKIEASLALDHELVIVDDHSVDATPALVKGLAAKFPHLRLVQNSAEKGFANAVKAGFAASRGTVVVPVMGDLCDDLSCLAAMYAKIDEGYDVVCGSRYMAGGRRIGGSRLKAFLSSVAGRSLYYLLGIPTHDLPNAFKMYRREVLERMELNAKGFDISMEIPLKAFFRGYRITEVPTVWRERTRGKSSFKIFQLLPSYLKLYLWALARRLRK